MFGASIDASSVYRLNGSRVAAAEYPALSTPATSASESVSTARVSVSRSCEVSRDAH